MAAISRTRPSESNEVAFWRRMALVGGGASLVLVAISLFAVVQTWRANAQARIADSRRVAAISESERGKRLDVSLLLAVEALTIEKTPEARNNLLAALFTRPELETFLHTSEGEVAGVAFSPDGKTLAVGIYHYRDGSGVGIFDTVNHERLQAAPLPETGGYITCVVFSPDGRTLAVGESGGVVLFDTTSRERLQAERLPVTEGEVWGVAYSPDGKTLAAGYSLGYYVGGGGVVLFDATSRQRLQAAPLPVPEGGVSGVVFSPDSKALAVGYDVGGKVRDAGGDVVVSGGVVLFDATSRQRLQAAPLPVPEGGVSGVAFSPDGKTLVAGYGVSSDDGSMGGVVVFNAMSRQRFHAEPLPGAERRVREVVISPDGRTIAAGFPGGVVLLHPQTGQQLGAAPLPVTEGDVSSVAISPDGKTLAAGFHGDGGGVALFNVMHPLWAGRRPRIQTALLRVREGEVSGVAISPDGKTLAAGFGNIPVGAPLDKSDPATDGGGRAFGGVVLFDATKHERLQAAPLSVPEGDVSGVAFKPDGSILAAGFGKVDGDNIGGVVLFDATKHERFQDGPLHVPEGNVWCVAFSPDCKTLAAGFGKVPPSSPVGHSLSSGVGGRGFGGVVLFDVTSRRRLQADPLQVLEGEVRSLVFSPDGKTLAAGSGKLGSGGVVLFNATSRQRLQAGPLPVPEGEVWSLAFSPDGKTLAAGDVDDGDGGGGVVLFDATSRQRLQVEPLEVNQGEVRSLAYSPDGKTLAAGDGNGGVILFDATTRQRIDPGRLSLTHGDVTSLAFSPDGKTLAVGDSSGVVWCDVDLESWKRLARQVANRNLTRAEWKLYFPDTPYRPTFNELTLRPKNTSDEE